MRIIRIIKIKSIENIVMTNGDRNFIPINTIRKTIEISKIERPSVNPVGSSNSLIWTIYSLREIIITPKLRINIYRDIRIRGNCSITISAICGIFKYGE